ncbi:MAG: hypothetical protein CSB48_01745 [Proteobacteria bacterium]|nr:MAG: hypothetical protein CSB48_01745 [Pseudomonadota bacterium]PIE40252.1 MAG: hypothetical protein CSA51_01710 [Gammaproteobacteria bacterium]
MSSNALAELTPLADEEMSEMTGQAMIAFDAVEVAGGNTYTRATVGLTSEFQINTDSVVLGEYALAGATPSSDVDISRLSFGHISTDASKVQLDGNTYALDDIVPFETIDPYFEISQDSTGELTGFRVGFGRARGTMSGNIGSLSGNIGLKLDDGGVISDAQLLTSAGVANSQRATHIGLESATTDCATLNKCAPLTNIKTLDVGTDNGNGTVGYTRDLFFSFQNQATDWQVNDGTGTGTVTANPGVYLNIPTSMTLDMTQLTSGVNRVRTEYIDRGVGVF